MVKNLWKSYLYASAWSIILIGFEGFIFAVISVLTVVLSNSLESATFAETYTELILRFWMPPIVVSAIAIAISVARFVKSEEFEGASLAYCFVYPFQYFFCARVRSSMDHD